MKHARAHLGMWMLASVVLLLSTTRAADSSSTSLEAQLRAQRPEILRWETQPVETGKHTPAGSSEVVSIGKAGPRTAVRFADGRVRWYAVAGFAPVLLSAHTVDAGASMTAGDTTRAERDVIEMGCRPLTRIETGARFRAARRLGTGEALCANAVQATPEVERNRPVVLSTQRGPVSVSRVLTATTDASAGERVRLRDPASGATVIAIVTGPGFARDPNSQEQK